VNLCEEYKGPIRKYQALGMTQLYLPTPDHFEPSVEDLQKAVRFIQKFEQEGAGRVYVHCRAGHGRSAAVVLAWLLSKQDPTTGGNRKELNEQLCKLRNVRKTLWKQENIKRFHEQLQEEQAGVDDMELEEKDN
jgi:atypical dual specificity phosphatase